MEKTLCLFLGQDPSKTGAELLAKKNLLAMRAEHEWVLAEKALLWECITHFAGEFKTIDSLGFGSESVVTCS